jgi:tetratricopeptide (TPR) repeat protein
MVQRLSKKPVSEAFDLWDKGYIFGAMRLFQFKVETSPPFQVAPCLEALATLLQQMGEDYDAQETFQLASEKFDMIQQPWSSRLMQCHIVEMTKGPDAALVEIAAAIKASDNDKSAKQKDEKTKSQIAKLYHYRAQLYFQAGKYPESEQDCGYACELGWDRVHLGFYTLGLCQKQKGLTTEATATFLKATQKNANYFPAYEELINVYKSSGDSRMALEFIAKAMEVHPKCSLLRDKAYSLSELKRNEEALKVLDEAIAKPPNDETEAHMGAGESASQLYRAKAAVLADLSRFDDALVALNSALELTPGDEEATRMKADINMLAAKDYLKKYQVPEFLDSLVGHVLRSRPENPVQAMIDAIEGNLV